MHPTLLKLGFLGINWFGKDNVGSDQVVKFLQTHEKVLVYENWIENVFSGFKWGVVKWLYHIDQDIFKLIPKAFDVKQLFKDAGVTGIKSELLTGGLITALLALSVIWFAIKKMFFPNESAELKEAITHLVISIVLITCTGTLVNKALELSEGVFNGAVQTSEGSLPFKLIKDNTLDLFELAKDGWTTKNIVTAEPNGKQKVTNDENSLSEKTFDTTDMNFIITPDVIDDIQDSDDLSKNVKKTLKDNLIYRLDHNESNDAVARKIDDGSPLNDIFMPGYSRFVAPGYVLIIGLISLGIASFFILYTIIDTILQLVIASILANLVYATDIETGQRTKAVVTDLINSAAVIGFTGVEYDFYAIGLTWSSKNITNPILNVMMLIALTMVLIMGSNAVLKYFNVDTAIKNNGNGLFKAAMAGNMAAHGAAGAANVAKEVGGTALHAAGNTANVARQALSGLRNSIDNHTSGPNMNPDQTSGGLGLGQMIAQKGRDLANKYDNSNLAQKTGTSFDQGAQNADSSSASENSSKEQSESTNDQQNDTKNKQNTQDSDNDSENKGNIGDLNVDSPSDDNEDSQTGNNNNPTINDFNENNNQNQNDNLNNPNANVDNDSQTTEVEDNVPSGEQKVSDLNDNKATNANSDQAKSDEIDKPKISDTNLSDDDPSNTKPDLNSDLSSNDKINDKVNHSDEANMNKIKQSFDNIRKQNEDNSKEQDS